MVEDRSGLRLLDLEGNLILELLGSEIEEAIRAGFLDRNDLHFSMYAYARLRIDARPFRGGPKEIAAAPDPVDSRSEPLPTIPGMLDPEDNALLASLGIRW